MIERNIDTHESDNSGSLYDLDVHAPAMTLGEIESWGTLLEGLPETENNWDLEKTGSELRNSYRLFYRIGCDIGDIATPPSMEVGRRWKLDALSALKMLSFGSTPMTASVQLVVPPIMGTFLISAGRSIMRGQQAVEIDADLESTFAQLADDWRKDTKLLSSIADKSMHPAYQRIIGMGPQVLPLILRELAERGGHWFWALRAITGENPVAAEDAGNINRMKDAWLRLGHNRGWI